MITPSIALELRCDSCQNEAVELSTLLLGGPPLENKLEALLDIGRTQAAKNGWEISMIAQTLTCPKCRLEKEPKIVL